MLLSLWRYRYFVLSTIRNELLSRFARSRLGGLWIVINPLIQVAIYALILSNVLAAKLPGIASQYGYAIYLMAGLLAWTLFSEILTRCLGLFIENGNLMKKVNFPRITLPVIALGSSLLNNGLLFIAMLGIFTVLGHGFSLAMLWLAPLTLLLAGFALGLGLVLGVLNVFMRDINQVVPIILQMGFWLTPIVYPLTIIPAEYHGWYVFNPLYPLVTAYQNVVLYGARPELSSLVPIALVATALLALGLLLFRRASAELVDAL